MACNCVACKAEVSSPATKLQRYERDVVNHQGGHYGEEQWTTVEMVPCETGAWVKYRDIEWAASPATPGDKLWQLIYEAAADAGQILNDDALTAIVERVRAEISNGL